MASIEGTIRLAEARPWEPRDYRYAFAAAVWWGVGLLVFAMAIHPSVGAWVALLAAASFSLAIFKVALRWFRWGRLRAELKVLLSRVRSKRRADRIATLGDICRVLPIPYFYLTARETEHRPKNPAALSNACMPLFDALMDGLNDNDPTVRKSTALALLKEGFSAPIDQLAQSRAEYAPEFNLTPTLRLVLQWYDTDHDLRQAIAATPWFMRIGIVVRWRLCLTEAHDWRHPRGQMNEYHQREHFDDETCSKCRAVRKYADGSIWLDGKQM